MNKAKRKNKIQDFSPKPGLYSDSQLWNAFKNGDQKSFETIFKNNFSFLLDYSLRITKHEEIAKDCIQDVFTYLWEKRENLSNIQSIRAYLISSLRHNLLKTLNKQTKHHYLLKIIQKEKVFLTPAFEDMLIIEEEIATEKKELKLALQKLPDRMHEALYLKTYQGITYKEIAEIMGVRPQVARNYICSAFKHLRKILILKPSL